MSVEALKIAKGENLVVLLPRMANRHGLVAGATGTGKTVTLQTMAESFSRIGVPVFLADVKGDLTGISQAGSAANTKIVTRLAELKLFEGFSFEGCPVTFWDIFGEQGHPLRATISEMGPLLLSRVMNLNDTQAGFMSIVFRVADENGLLLLDLKDLRAMIQYVGENAKTFTTSHGNVAPATVGAVQRGLLRLQEQGGEKLFGEPAIDLQDLLRVDHNGHGVINILAADKLLSSPLLYGCVLLWLLSELYENLPEVGDLDKPKLVFFFDEAHLLFSDAPPSLLEKIEQVVRLIRSKAVGVYFVTQNPTDVPDTVLGQLGNRVQHALRAFTPRDQKAVKAAASTFRQSPKLDTEKVIQELAIGEALISFLDEKGMPAPVQRAWVIPPHSQVGTITPDQRQKLIRSSHMYGRYEKVLDRESAYELLKKRAEEAKVEAEETKPRPKAAGRQPESIFVAFAKSTARSLGSSIGRSLSRGVLGGIFGMKTGR